jgi:mannopine transport system permease protein
MRGAGAARRHLALLLLLPALILFVGAFLYPIGALLAESFTLRGVPSLDHYQRLFTRPLYVTVLLRTLRVGALTTLTCLAIGFPLALWLTRLNGVALRLAIVCILLPLWTSILVRSYAWVALLQPDGLINRTLAAAGLIEAPLALLYTEGAVIVAMVHVLLPYMVLPIYGALLNVPPNLSRAAQSLGAGAFAEFRTVVLPLARAGVVAGCVMVFVLAIGFFITPALLGGPRTMLISTLINQQITSVLNWSFGGALGTVLLAASLAIVLGFNAATAGPRRAARAS